MTVAEFFTVVALMGMIAAGVGAQRTRTLIARRRQTFDADMRALARMRVVRQTLSALGLGILFFVGASALTSLDRDVKGLFITAGFVMAVVVLAGNAVIELVDTWRLENGR